MNILLTPRCPVQLYLLSAGAGNGGSLPVRNRGLRLRDGVCAGVGLDEHALLHQRIQTDRILQHHDTKGERLSF